MHILINAEIFTIDKCRQMVLEYVLVKMQVPRRAYQPMATGRYKLKELRCLHWTLWPFYIGRA